MVIMVITRTDSQSLDIPPYPEFHLIIFWCSWLNNYTENNFSVSEQIPETKPRQQL